MSLMKRCKDILESGPLEDKYLAARFVIITSVNSRKLETLREKQDLYSEMIDSYASQYNLKKTKLGKVISGTGID